VTAEGEVADGHLVIEAYFQNIMVEGEGPEPELAGATCTRRVAWLNGAMVLDPELSQRLFAELMRQ
jgi:hypothetical protein